MNTYFKKPLYSAIIFFSTLGILSIGYGAYNALSPVNTGDPLTKAIWNQMADNIADLNSRISTLASSVSLWASNGSDISYNAGNVGIGTSSPEKQLHLKSQAGTNSEINIQTSGKPKWGIYHDEASEDLRFWNLSNILTLQKNGNVGIGTTTPSSRLTLGKSLATGYNTMLRLDENSNAGANAMGIDWRFGGLAGFPWGDGGSVGRISVERQGSTSNFDMVFGNASSTNFSEKMRIVGSNGRVGIGTASPSSNLTVQNSTDGSDTAMQLRSADGGFASNQELRMDYQQGLVTTSRQSMTYFNPDWGFNFYGYVSGLNTNPIMTMRGNGNVGIGTINPLATFETRGNIRTSWAQGARYGMEFWSVSSLNGTSCNISCNNGYCIGGYIDDDTSTKVSCAATTPNKNCICIGRP